MDNLAQQTVWCIHALEIHTTKIEEKALQRERGQQQFFFEYCFLSCTSASMVVSMYTSIKMLPVVSCCYRVCALYEVGLRLLQQYIATTCISPTDFSYFFWANDQTHCCLVAPLLNFSWHRLSQKILVASFSSFFLGAREIIPGPGECAKFIVSLWETCFSICHCTTVSSVSYLKLGEASEIWLAQREKVGSCV